MQHKDLLEDRALPVDPGAALDRLSLHFGDDAIRSLVTGFAVTLTDALAALDAGRGEQIAHRVAGIAGTLGFSDVSKRWLALPEDGGGTTDAIRRDSADALRLIADRYGNVRDAKTSV